MREADVPVRESLLLRGSFDSEEVTRLCSPLFSRARSRSLPTALFTTNGTAAIAALKALYAAGLRTPDDLAFATIDEITSEEFFEPRITSVVQPAFDMGYRAVEVLLDRISKDNSDTSRVKARLPAKLVIRDSSSRAFGRG
jgi:DNA-binding LacI/PurR family transcriptional regulator